MLHMAREIFDLLISGVSRLVPRPATSVWFLCMVVHLFSVRYMFNQIHGQLRLSLCRILLSAGRSACIGLGFADRGDSFDLLVSLQDHFK
jgi:Protein of unknown function (DUF1681)